jgi:hypothetical protein
MVLSYNGLIFEVESGLGIHKSWRNVGGSRGE